MVASHDDSGNGRIEAGRLQEKVERLDEMHRPGGECPLRWLDMETRMRKIEGWRWQIVGAIVLIQALGVSVILKALAKATP